jgi:threonyl-tRNA synthetase
MRVRAFTQDDAHIFCTPDQITAEAVKVTELILSIYRDFGFDDVRIKFSDRPAKRVGSDEIWDKAESALRQACEAAGIETTLNPGEGAFYGPKLEFVLARRHRPRLAVRHPAGGLQPARAPGRGYVGEDSQKHTPVMLHRAMFGSLERFIGILIEHHAGQTAHLAGAGAGGGHGNYRPAGQILPGSCGKPEKSGASGRNGLEV